MPLRADDCYICLHNNTTNPELFHTRGGHEHTNTDTKTLPDDECRRVSRRHPDVGARVSVPTIVPAKDLDLTSSRRDADTIVIPYRHQIHTNNTRDSLTYPCEYGQGRVDQVVRPKTDTGGATVCKSEKQEPLPSTKGSPMMCEPSCRPLKEHHNDTDVRKTTQGSTMCSFSYYYYYVLVLSVLVFLMFYCLLPFRVYPWSAVSSSYYYYY